LKILVATDGSKGSEKAVKFASKLAAEGKGVLSLIHVIPHLPTLREDIISVVKEEIGSPRKTGEEYLADGQLIAEKYLSEVNTILKEGDPVKVILEEAEKNSFDLIVVGSYGRGFVGEFLLGSVSSKLVHRSPIPVLIVR
jgi:nucleotide-binding universal stress UspA family protein